MEFLVALVTEASVGSSWCQKELSIAMTGGLSREGVKVLPVRIGDVAVPPTLADVYYLSAVPDNLGPTIRKLIADIQSHHEDRIGAQNAGAPLPTSGASPVIVVSGPAHGGATVRADPTVVDAEPIRIVGIVKEGVGQPRSDASPGSALYRVPLRLSRTPSQVWVELLVECWDNPPKQSATHRPGILSVVGDTIVLDSTSLDDLEEVHIATLKSCIEMVNAADRQLDEGQGQRRALERHRHGQKIDEIGDRIIFDDESAARSVSHLQMATAVDELKLYLPDPTQSMRVRDLVVGEANHVRRLIADADFPVDVDPDAQYARDRAVRYESISQTLIKLMAAGGTWALNDRPFVEALDVVANPSFMWTGNSLLTNFRRYPALLCLYAIGVAATGAQRWGTLRALTYDPIVVDLHGRHPAAFGLHQWIIFDGPDGGTWLPGAERRYAPISDHLYAVLREPLRNAIGLDVRYAEAFDRFEYLLGLVIADQDDQESTRLRAPVGRIGWRHREPDGKQMDPVVQIPAEADAAGDQWGPLAAGMFGGEWARVRKAIADYQVIVRHIRESWSRR
jgi:hypothetical protein